MTRRGAALAAMPPGVRVRVSTLIRLLASEAQGERDAALRTLERTLTTNGLSFGHLADALVEPDESSPTNGRDADAVDLGGAPPATTEGMVGDLVRCCREHLLLASEAEFIFACRDRFARYGFLPERDVTVLSELWSRARSRWCSRQRRWSRP